MQIHKTIGGAVLGTSIMTLYSYCLSLKRMRNFREPDILTKLIKRLLPHTSKQYDAVAAWVLHYAVGLFFSVVYIKLWRGRQLVPELVAGALAGAATGLFAVAVWHTVLSLHPNPPNLKLRKYYGQLIVAHAFFGMGWVLGKRV